MENSRFVDILRERIASDPDLSPAGLAVRAGLNNSTIRQMIEKGRSPRIDTAMKICHALGETLDSFLTKGRDPVTAEILFHLDQLSDEERRLLLSAARGLRARDHEAGP